MIRIRGGPPVYGYWPWHLTTVVHRAFVFSFPGCIVAVCRLYTPLIDLAHGLLPDRSGSLSCRGTVPDMFIVLLLKLASSTKACWVQVGLAGLHGIQSG